MSHKNKTQKKTLKSKSKFTRWPALIVGLIIAGIGTYMLFFAAAATNNCSNLYSAAQIKDGGSAPPETTICDINQASNPAGNDSVASIDGEVQNLVSQGWTDWGVAFRAPSKAVNGAIGVHRFNDKRLGAHVFITVTDPLFNQFRSDPANYVDEGLRFYAWPDARQPGTEAVYRVNRKAPHLMQLYSTNLQWVNHFVSNTDGTWENGGVPFYAYPSNYFPPVPSNTPAKNDNCPNQNLKPGDKGACVKSHKAALNTLGAKLDANNDTFDGTTSDNTRLFVTALQQRGVKVSAYSNVVTKEIWDAIAKGYPVAPTPAAPASPATTPGTRTNTGTGTTSPVDRSGGGAASGGGGSTDGNTNPSYSDYCPQTYPEIATSGGKHDGKPLKSNCIKWWQHFVEVPTDGKWGSGTEKALQFVAAFMPPDTVVENTNTNDNARNNQANAWEEIAKKVAESKTGDLSSSYVKAKASKTVIIRKNSPEKTAAVIKSTQQGTVTSGDKFCNIIKYSGYLSSGASGNYWTFPVDACHHRVSTNSQQPTTAKKMGLTTSEVSGLLGGATPSERAKSLL